MIIRQMAALYLQSLLQVGIPQQDAITIAWAIAKFDKGGAILPNENQAIVIAKYRLAIIDANLWRSAFNEVIGAIAA